MPRVVDTTNAGLPQAAVMVGPSGRTLVVMNSMEVYWIPVCYVLSGDYLTPPTPPALPDPRPLHLRTCDPQLWIGADPPAAAVGCTPSCPA